MKVILLEDVKSLGKKGDVVDVSDGYAKNFLITKKKGVEANSKNLNDLKLQKAKSRKRYDCQNDQPRQHILRDVLPSDHTQRHCDRQSARNRNDLSRG